MEKRTFEVKCTDCGKTTTVPFRPTPGKPVYCKACFSKHRQAPQENRNMNFSFDPKHAWARRGDDWKGRSESEPESIFKT